MRYADRQARRTSRASELDPTRIRMLEDDADQNEREHVAAETRLADAISNVNLRIGQMEGKVEKLTWALAAASLSLAASAIALVATRL